jgi:hypothetical protein
VHTQGTNGRSTSAAAYRHYIERKAAAIAATREGYEAPELRVVRWHRELDARRAEDHMLDELEAKHRGMKADYVPQPGSTRDDQFVKPMPTLIIGDWSRVARNPLRGYALLLIFKKTNGCATPFFCATLQMALPLAYRLIYA